MELEAKGKRACASSSSSLTGGDRLSSLPDCLIHHIMSFMKARQLVQACVLFTRWKHLWRSVPCLNIDQKEFETTGPNCNREGEWDKFQDFTDHLLIPNNISIGLLDTFQLHMSDTYWGKEAAKWIRHGIKYSAQKPGVQSQGLTSSSWRLRGLHLSNVNLDDSFMKHVSSECQYLQDLKLKGCSCTFHEITSHSLEKLILKNCHCNVLSAITSPTLKSLVIGGGRQGYTKLYSLLVITAPAVAYLRVDVDVSFNGGISVQEMPYLAIASIRILAIPSFYIFDDDIDDDDIDCKLSRDQLKLLCSVSNVTTLVLSRFQTMVLGEKSMAFPNFKNLRILILDCCDLSDNFKTLEHFLKNSPDLEKLTLRRCKFPKDLKRKRAKRSQYLNLVDVRCKNLKHTEIIYKDGVRQVFKLLLSISGNLPKNNIKLTKVD